MSARGGGPGERPVLYLDLDDTVVSWATGEPRGAEDAGPFLRWALDRFEVRWLTTWAPSGLMDGGLLVDLCKLTGIPAERLQRIRGLDWEGGTKVDGIAWVEHVVMGRPFVWIEDDTVPPAALEFLDHHGYLACFHRCDVTRDAEALRRLHGELEAAWG
jgi:hypothetical protein